MALQSSDKVKMKKILKQCINLDYCFYCKSGQTDLSPKVDSNRVAECQDQNFIFNFLTPSKYD